MKARLLTALLLSACAAPHASAGTIIDDWASVKVPPPPELRTVTVDPKTTALLLLDFNGHEAATSGPCNTANKPRCLASVPKVRELLLRARAKGVLVVYSLSAKGTAADVRPELGPMPNDPVVQSGPNKFVGTRLAGILSDRRIRTLIVTGTASEGDVLDTGTDAALKGMNIVVPVDGMSSTELYAEQYVAWHLTHAPGVSQKTMLTTTDRIGF